MNEAMKDMAYEKSHTNAKEIDNKNYSEELREIEVIKNTPFRAINDGKGWYLTMGDYKVSNEVEKKEELVKKVKALDWEMLVPILGVMVETIINQREFEKTITVKDMKGERKNGN